LSRQAFACPYSRFCIKELPRSFAIGSGACARIGWTSELLEETIVNEDRSARSQRVRARKRSPLPSPSETAAPKPAELERSTEHSKEAKSMNDATVSNAVKLAGEGLIAPGTSLLLDGDFKAGGAHVIAGLAAKALLGPICWLLVAASSYSRSTTGKKLHEHFTKTGGETTPGT